MKRKQETREKKAKRAGDVRGAVTREKNTRVTRAAYSSLEKRTAGRGWARLGAAGASPTLPSHPRAQPYFIFYFFGSSFVRTCNSIDPCFFSPNHCSQWLVAMVTHAMVRMPSMAAVSILGERCDDGCFASAAAVEALASAASRAAPSLVVVVAAMGRG